jgi:hypothetical protein
MPTRRAFARPGLLLAGTALTASDFLLAPFMVRQV